MTFLNNFPPIEKLNPYLTLTNTIFWIFLAYHIVLNHPFPNMIWPSFCIPEDFKKPEDRQNVSKSVNKYENST